MSEPLAGAGPGDPTPRVEPLPDRLSIERERLFHDWRSACERALAYLAALGLAAPRQRALAEEATVRAATRPAAAGGGALAATFAELRALLLRSSPQRALLPSPGEPDEFVAWRLDSVLARGQEMAAPLARSGPRRLASMPLLARGAMIPHRFVRRGLRRAIARVPFARSAAEGSAPRPDASARRWSWAARRRRVLLAVLVLIPSVIAGEFMLDVLPQKGNTLHESGIAICFGALFGWISIGFWTATLGFLLLIGRRDRFAITRAAPTDVPIDPATRTAIVMPICEEPVARVFSGLRAIHGSLARTGELARFDFFVLSDSSDPSTTVEEEAAWFDWCRAVDGFGRIFYRRRRVRIERKSGNVADFCRRWGKRYRYMVILDADSMMSGEAIVRLVQIMEASPDVGMVQTAPASVLRRSLFARAQQFASRLYGTLFAAGLHYWQLGEGQYWGHNAVIRVAPFMDYCHLPRLPGGPPLGGEIMSHDFVEAALMGRAGWALWLAYDLPGSYEEPPSSLLEEMKRDRRWCQGNFQHLRLLAIRGFKGAHRALFLNGVLSYVSALLWFCFLVLSTTEAIWEALRPPVYFPPGKSLFPEWPVWRPDWAIALMAVTGAILFLPKLLAILLLLLRGGTRSFGGLFRVLASALLEVLISTLLAPIRMVFHARFVIANLLGRTVGWRSAARSDSETGWGEAIRRHGIDTLVASGWASAVFALNPHYFWWLTPIVVALILSIPLSVYTSRVRLGERAHALGLFLTPEETSPPPEIEDLGRELAAAGAARDALGEAERDGFVRAVVDPVVNAMHCALTGTRRSLKPRLRAAREALVQRALADGPQALASPERRSLLSDPERMIQLHRLVWQSEDPEAVRRWGLPESCL